MPPTNPRVIVADDREGIYEIARASLELLGRRPRLIETHSGDDALFELRVSSPDLLISAHTLPGTTNGPMLALMAKRELAALPVLVIGNENDPEMDEETLSQSPFVYMRRPLVPEAFIRQLRIALDGPEAVPQEVAPVDIMGPVPTVDHERLRPMMFRLMRDVGAMAAVMADRNGKVTIYEGAAGYFDRDALAAALGPSFASTAKLVGIIGDQPRVLKYYEAEKLYIYCLAVGLHFFVMIVFDAATKEIAKRAIGAVNRYGPATVNEMLEIIGEAAFSMKPAVITPPPIRSTQETRAVSPKRSRRSTQEAKVVTQHQAEQPATRQAKPEAPAVSAPTMTPIENFDASLFDGMGDIDLSNADDLFNPDAMAASAAGTAGNRISFEDAMLQGIISDVEE